MECQLNMTLVNTVYVNNNIPDHSHT